MGAQIKLQSTTRESQLQKANDCMTKAEQALIKSNNKIWDLRNEIRDLEYKLRSANEDYAKHRSNKRKAIMQQRNHNLNAGSCDSNIKHLKNLRLECKKNTSLNLEIDKR